MRPIFLVLLLSTFIFCVDVDVKKLSSMLSGMSEEEQSKLDEVMARGKSGDYKGKKGKVRLNSILKEKNLYEKMTKLDETMKVMGKENHRALGFMAEVIELASETRLGVITADESSTMAKKAWGKLRRTAKKYLLKKFPKLKEVPNLSSK